MSINKNFVELYALLSDNQEMKVIDLLPQIEELMQKSVTDKTFRYNEDGVLEIFCWYHKEWENTQEIEYGKKASNKSTGLNTFCKVGVNQWTKQQRDYKAKSSALLEKIQTGELKPEDLKAEMDRLALERDKIEPRQEYLERKEAEKQEKLLNS